MRKPISKNALRRAMEGAQKDGQLQCTVPVNTVVDRIWHDMERENYEAPRKRPAPERTPLRAAVVTDTELE